MHKPQILLKKAHEDKPSKKSMRVKCLGHCSKFWKLLFEDFVHVSLLLDDLPYNTAWIQKCGLTFLERSTEYCMDITLFCPADFILLICYYRKSNCISPLEWLYSISNKVNSLTTWNFLGILWCNNRYRNPSLQVLHKKPTLFHMKGFVCFALFCFPKHQFSSL